MLIKYGIVAVLVSFLLTGCWGARDIEHMTFVNTVGIDYVNGKIVLYTQFVGFTNISKKEAAGGGNQEETIAIGRAEGDTFDHAIFNLYASSQQRLAWSHIKALVFSEAALKHNVVSQVLDVWDRYYEYRYVVWTFASKRPLDEIFNAKPILNTPVLYSRLNNPREIYSQYSKLAPLYLNEFIWRWEEKAQTVVLPDLDLTELAWEQDEKPLPKLFSRGACILQNRKLIGCPSYDDLIGVRWLEPKTMRTPVFVKQDDETPAGLVVEKIKSKIKASVNGGKPVFKIQVKASGYVPQMVPNLREEKFVQLAEEEIKAEIMKTYLNGLEKKADYLNLSDKLYRTDPKAWHELQEDGRLPLQPDSIESIDVKVTIFSGGISKMKNN